MAGGSNTSLQQWGIVVGAGVILAALGAATFTTPSENATPVVSVAAPAQTPAQTPAGDPSADGTEVVAKSGEPVFQPAEAPAPPAPALGGGSQNASFVVRFETEHPMGRAQTLASQGRLNDASEAARQTIRTRRDLRGLCFDRFTAGGAEVVLRACSSVPRRQRASFERTWTQRLTAMSGIEYAEPNHTLYPEGQN